MGVVESLTNWGILRAADVVELAAAAGLPLNVATALLEQESGGGQNSWGHDRVANPGIYTSGHLVDEPTYRNYRRALAAKTAGQQGIGPCQLTSIGFVDQADALGGVWLPRPNMQVGFGLLAGYIRQWGLADAFRAYNGGAGNRRPGSNANADFYSSLAMAKTAKWADRIGPAVLGAQAGTAIGIPTSRPAMAEEEPVMNVPITVYPDGTFHGGIVAEEGSTSRYIAEATLVFGVMFGSADVYLQFLGADGLGMGPSSGLSQHVGQNGTVAIDAPDGCKLVSVEGRVYGQGVIPTAVLLTKPKA